MAPVSVRRERRECRVCSESREIHYDGLSGFRVRQSIVHATSGSTEAGMEPRVVHTVYGRQSGFLDSR